MSLYCLPCPRYYFFYHECCIDVIKCEDMVYYSGTVSLLI